MLMYYSVGGYSVLMIMDLSALRLCVVWFFFLVFFPLCNRRLSA